MRGTLIPHLRRAGRTGIIPAYAGNTIRAGPPLPEHRDHPRVCGEHLSSVTMTTRTVGSSPRMRGTLTANTQPARAFGSSPRMRGTRECRTRHAVPLRIIPAYAGNTKPVWRTPRGIWDHPRVCGEHLSTFLIYVITKGSSPRMRGTLLRHRRRMRSGGIIPAYAGNTCVYFVFELCCRDHPRVCGEHIADKMRVLAKKGSSPRMRGTRAVSESESRAIGIIPAYAGNTFSARLLTNGGEGSSPRMRGTPSRCP